MADGANAEPATMPVADEKTSELILLPVNSVSSAETNGGDGGTVSDNLADDSFFDDSDPMASVPDDDTRKTIEGDGADEVEYDQFDDSQDEEENNGVEMHEEYVEDSHEIDALVDEEEPEAEAVEEEAEDEEFIEDEDAEMEDGNEEEEEEQEPPPTPAPAPPVQRPPTQVPKKRKPAAVLEEIMNDDVSIGACAPAPAAADVDQKETQPIKEEIKKKMKMPLEKSKVKEKGEIPAVEQTTRQSRSVTRIEEQVSEEQCRVCTVQQQLVSLFVKDKNGSTPAEMLHTICPNVSIANKDFMPQYICEACLERVKSAIDLKVQCETTETELRKKLSRSKNKVRRPTGFVTIDAPLESEPSDGDDNEEEFASDVEFKVTDEGSLTADDDSADSDFSAKPRKPKGRPSGAKRGRPRIHFNTPTARNKMKIIGEDMDTTLSKKKQTQQPQQQHLRKKSMLNSSSSSMKANPPPPAEFPCDECDQIFTRKLSLVLHKKTHINSRDIINCEVCGKQFKMKGAYRTHMAKHKQNAIGYKCKKCPKIFPDKDLMRRHIRDAHDGNMVYRCARCQRTFVSRLRLQRHQDGHCHGGDGSSKVRRAEYENYAMGKDLFKAVAPMTTTYWSDSFSD